MPDLQTELSKVINTWNQTEQPVEQTDTAQAPEHVGKKVFDLVQAYPNRTMGEYEQLAASIGVSAASAKNYIMLFSKSTWGLTKCDNGRYTVCSDTYKTKNEMMGIPKGQRISKVKRRKIMKARLQGTQAAQLKPRAVPQVGRGVLQDLLIGRVRIYPGIPRGHLLAYAVKCGMKEDSAKVTMRALLRDGRLVEKDDAGLYLPGTHMVDPLEVMKDLEQQAVTETLTKENEKLKRIRSLEEEVESLTIREARALYEQLQKYFSF